jgi:hypothetical protein
LWKPSDAKGAYSSIKAGIDAVGWPTTGTLKGKFIFVITANQVCASGCYVANETGANAASAFIAYNDIGIYTTSTYRVFYNQEYTNRGIGGTIHTNGQLYQAYPNDIDVSTEWDSAVTNGFTHICTEQINYHENTWR